MTNLDRDYPDRATKPIDNPYGPFADPFPIEQHRLGPFKPIEAFYEQLRRR
jgi:thiosulfate dehydrogenase